MRKIKRICLWSGSSKGNKPEFMEQTANLVKYLALNNIGIVYGWK